MIRPNCRARLTRDDLSFLCGAGGEFLLTARSLDDLMDDEAVWKRLLEDENVLRVSPGFYFYTLIRHVFRERGLEDRELADYVASVLVEYAPADHPFRPAPGDRSAFPSLSSLLALLEEAGPKARFTVQAELGNLALLLTGMFPRHVESRTARCAAPSLQFYEDIGRRCFHEASDHPLAEAYTVAGVFAELSQTFRETRMALNELSERVCFLDTP